MQAVITAVLFVALITLIVIIGIAVLMAEPTLSGMSRSEPAPSPEDKPDQAAADELRRIREAESEVERISRETQDAIIKRAMWRALWRQGSGSE